MLKKILYIFLCTHISSLAQKKIIHVRYNDKHCVLELDEETSIRQIRETLKLSRHVECKALRCGMVARTLQGYETVHNLIYLYGSENIDFQTNVSLKKKH